MFVERYDIGGHYLVTYGHVERDIEIIPCENIDVVPWSDHLYGLNRGRNYHHVHPRYALPCKRWPRNGPTEISRVGVNQYAHLRHADGVDVGGDQAERSEGDY